MLSGIATHGGSELCSIWMTMILVHSRELEIEHSSGRGHIVLARPE